MKRGTKTALGIDVGDRTISVALVEKTDQGIRIVAGATEDLPGEQDKGRTRTPGRILSRVLRKLGRRAMTRGIQTAVATPARSAILRLLDLPKQMPANIGEFVEGELKQYVAMSGRQMSSDFCGVGIGSSSRKRLLTVVADATEVSETLGICRASGTWIAAVEPSVLACVRALLLADKGMRRGSSLIAMLTRTNLVLCLFTNGILDFVRHRETPAGMDTPELLRAWLCEELNAVLRYSRTDARGEPSPWQAKLVIRETAFTKEQLANLPALEPAVKTLQVLDCQDLPEGLPGISKKPPTASLPAVGAALRLLDMEGDELRIDLTPEEVVQSRRSSRRGLIAANAAAVGLLAVFLFVELLTRASIAMGRRIEQNRIAGRLDTMPAMIAEDRFIDAEIDRMTRQLAGLEAVRSRRQTDWPAMLRSIGRAAPEGVCLTQIDCRDSETLRLKGVALSHGHARGFVQRLDNGTPFASVQLARLQRMQATSDAVEYEINCVLKSKHQEYDRGQGS